MHSETQDIQVFTAKDLTTDQEVRWCPGCGDYSILKQVQTVVPELGCVKKKLFLFRALAARRVFRITWKRMACIPSTEEQRPLHPD